VVSADMNNWSTETTGVDFKADIGADGRAVRRVPGHSIGWRDRLRETDGASGNALRRAHQKMPPPSDASPILSMEEPAQFC
jgi:hypothetical protein